MSIAEKLARKVWDDLCDRRGLKWEAQKVNDYVRDCEIIPRWASYFDEALELAAQAAEQQAVSPETNDTQRIHGRACRMAAYAIRRLKSPAGPVQPSQDQDEHA